MVNLEDRDKKVCSLSLLSIFYSLCEKEVGESLSYIV